MNSKPFNCNARTLRPVLTTCLFALALASVTPMRAVDVFGAPAFVDYQGRALDGSGAALSPGLSTNYKMQFRLYDQQTGGTVIWAEEQVVTVRDGLFSVQLGAGSAIASQAAEVASLAQAFQGQERFLGVTIIIPGQTLPEITPRLAFRTAPYSFVAGRAAAADRVVQAVGSEPSALIAGSVSYAPSVISTSGTLVGDRSNIQANAATTALTLTLPTGPAVANREFTVTKTDITANVITVAAPAGGNLNGVANGTVLLPLQGDSVTLRHTDGTNWWIASRYNLRAVNTAPNGSVALTGGLTTGGAIATTGTVSATGAISAGGNLSATGAISAGGNINGKGFAFVTPGDTDGGMFSDADGVVQFRTQNAERMRINDVGSIGNQHGRSKSHGAYHSQRSHRGASERPGNPAAGNARQRLSVAVLPWP